MIRLTTLDGNAKAIRRADVASLEAAKDGTIVHLKTRKAIRVTQSVDDVLALWRSR